MTQLFAPLGQAILCPADTEWTSQSPPDAARASMKRTGGGTYR